MTVKTIAKKLGISHTTVYLYLKDPETKRISPQTKRKIKLLIEQGYPRLNPHAQTLARKKSHAVAILIPMNVPYFHSVIVTESLCGIQQVLFQKGYRFLFLPSQGGDSLQILKDQLKHSGGYDGYILYGTRDSSLEEMKANVETLQKYRVPFVVLNMPELEYDINQVICRTPNSADPFRYLFQLGHRDIALLAGSSRAPDTQQSIQQYFLFFQQLGLEASPGRIMYGNYEKVIARSEVLKLLSKDRGITAIVSLNDSMALGAYEAIKELGLTIPAHISVIGKDDATFAGSMCPPLTTVRIPMVEMGQQAATLLFEAMSGAKPRKIYLTSELVVRESVSPAIRSVLKGGEREKVNMY